MGLPSGSQYPCSVGNMDDAVYCHYEKGSTTNYGTPIRIYISRFTPRATLSLRILFTNPDVVSSFPSFRFRVMGGSFSDPELMGNELYGRYTITDAFKVLPADSIHFSSHSSCLFTANKGIYATATRWWFRDTVSQAANSYVILEWKLTHPSWGEVSEFTHSDTASDYQDYYMVSYSNTDRRVYLVKKLSSSFTSTSDHIFGSFRNKHFRDTSAKIYALRTPDFSDITCNIFTSWMQTNRMNEYYGTPVITSVDVEDR